MMKMEIESFDFHLFIQNILNHYEIFKLNEKYQFIYENKESMIIKADKKKLEQVLYNLINNAIQYTGEDKIIEISVTIRKKEYLIEIKNTGVPIPKDDLENIWNKYYKSNKTHQRNVIGTGLGLSIVKQILELHNFEYGVISTEKKGTIFYFKIPRE